MLLKFRRVWKNPKKEVFSGKNIRYRLGFSEKVGMRLYLIGFLAVFSLSCSEKVDYIEEDFAAIYASTVDTNGRILQCNSFNDDTFRGKVRPVENKKRCFDIKISKYPDNFFNTENTFLQIYPSSVTEDATKHGKSLPIDIYKNGDDSAPLVQSKIIDSYLVNEEIKTSTKSFFDNHYFRLCDLTQDWDIIQLVIYLRRSNYDEPSPIRITKFLLPPFLANPNHFKQERGDALWVYHPFFKIQNSLQIEPSSYYKISESACNSDF